MLVCLLYLILTGESAELESSITCDLRNLNGNKSQVLVAEWHIQARPRRQVWHPQGFCTCSLICSGSFIGVSVPWPWSCCLKAPAGAGCAQLGPPAAASVGVSWVCLCAIFASSRFSAALQVKKAPGCFKLWQPIPGCFWSCRIAYSADSMPNSATWHISYAGAWEKRKQLHGVIYGCSSQTNPCNGNVLRDLGREPSQLTAKSGSSCI